MEQVTTQRPSRHGRAHVVLGEDAVSALLQLPDAERKHITDALDLLADGKITLHEPVASRLKDAPDIYLLRIPESRDIRVIARVDRDSDQIVIEDVLRASMLAKVFHAREA